eukprot:CAMPEP_0170732058 /NCGR_PEP_ID=MMETSP0437-20130122/1361_1 /TAXON_ID=0 /ORGANISM="Sexangularia sp." /LENGTH=218 /DNA_ID=CAMNT_0011070293 /DNA_START=112 /DNA_END=768 /DNA_ORIENTATION=-
MDHMLFLIECDSEDFMKEVQSAGLTPHAKILRAMIEEEKVDVSTACSLSGLPDADVAKAKEAKDAEFLRRPLMNLLYNTVFEQYKEDHLDAGLSLSGTMLKLTSDEGFVELFYDRFFELSPSSRDKFPSIEQQHKAFRGFVNNVVSAEGGFNGKYLRTLSKKHAKMNVSREEFGAFRDAFVQTARECGFLTSMEIECVRDVMDYLVHRLSAKEPCCIM